MKIGNMKTNRKILDEMLRDIKERSKRSDGSVDYAYISGYLQGFLETACILGFDEAFKNAAKSLEENYAR